MNTKGEFEQANMSQKSDSLEESKELYLSFSEAFSEISSEYTTLDKIQAALDHILSMFEVLDNIVIDYELTMVNPHIHGIFGCIINTNLLEKFIKIYNLGEGKEESLAKVSTLRIL